MKLASVFILAILVYSCSEPTGKVKDLRDTEKLEEVEYVEDEVTPEFVEDIIDSAKTASKPAKSEWSYKVISINENNWGYQIYQKGSMVINQTTIPSVQGIDGFDSKEKAELTAKHIINKVEMGIFPPTVNKEELEKLGVLRD